ncbi:1,4-alpha-glucan branching protein GlgB [Enhydrobacter sp.]|uniref:1,4-alpha-glucan branching protein GlgB n=1 Tax=Enhydrobacter sp. TaxID=1894999 RepID=UPI00262D2BAB|nr:1,4-alpha-glucan branching protein GlgB [Enhydrobacter sp.]WIM12645.1 MAG: 1,4-alpha-glucan (glycogen) branching enzyme, GH-13-type [Enhydrobacter sp.]
MSAAAILELPREEADALAGGRHSDPFKVLGPHDTAGGRLIRACLPGALGVEVLRRTDGVSIGSLADKDGSGLFEGVVSDRSPYLLRIKWPQAVQETEDPYSFGLLLGDLDLHLFNEGRHFELASVMGANAVSLEGVEGVGFSVWAPNASRVAVVGDFNSWDSRRHPMRLRFPAGVWELFIPRVTPGARYKFDIIGPGGVRLPQKADPLAQQAEPAPATASVVASPKQWRWHDEAWMQRRAERQAATAPISIYEVHLGSWMRGGGTVSWETAAQRLIPYVVDMGFTHLELLPIAEYPFGGSWGYQPLGLFAPTGRYGAPDEFAKFVDRLHAAGIGLILDWVPAHFPTDPHGLARFDGTALYEHLDPREGFHRDWNTYIYNFGRREVQGFLIASALHWLEHFHIDGLRVDAVASMLYRDYSRGAGDWIPNVYGGREHLEAIDFLRHLNAVVKERCPGVVTIAEESTAWPGVTRSERELGLGFSYKWNMGWMHDTLLYMERDPIHRSYHHDEMTFGLLYGFSEKFILPLSHDEVVHGKGSLLGKMPGDRWRKFANLRAYFGFMWSHPGKKLLFMGGEIAQEREWNHDREIDWFLLDNPEHAGMQRLVRDLNHLYRGEPALHVRDSEPAGFRWIVGDDRSNSVFAYFRTGHDDHGPVLVVCNMTPTPRSNYRIGVPRGGVWREIMNTDSRFYGGSDMGNGGALHAVSQPMHGETHSLDLTLPPLSTLYLRAES